jgi:Fe-S cluster biogenesis protein NfuA
MAPSPKIRFESTPNPQTFRFSRAEPGPEFTESPQAFNSAVEAQFSPLPKRIFGFPWAAGVYVAPDFITITKQNWVDWDMIAEPLAGLIEEHLDSGAPVLGSRPSSSSDASRSGTSNATDPENSHSYNPGDTPAVTMIKRVLDEEIRPMVAQDGGDVVFEKYEDQVVYLHMRGSCAGCPSSTMTLKMGIETRLKDAVPEIREVVSI